MPRSRQQSELIGREARLDGTRKYLPPSCASCWAGRLPTVRGRESSACVAASKRWCPGRSHGELKKRSLPPQSRAIDREERRLRNLPRYTAGRTPVYGRTMEFIDAATYLQMRDELCRRQLYRFTARMEQPVIIDGRAKIGFRVLCFKCLYPGCRIIAFEADPAIFEVLQRNCVTYELENGDLIPKSFWICETMLEFQQEGSLAGRISTTDRMPKPCRCSPAGSAITFRNRLIC